MSQHSVAETIDHSLYGLCWCFWSRSLVQVTVPDIDWDDGIGLTILSHGLARLLAPVEGEIDDGGIPIPDRETCMYELINQTGIWSLLISLAKSRPVLQIRSRDLSGPVTAQYLRDQLTIFVLLV